jgi:phosphoglycolate phosphatase
MAPARTLILFDVDGTLVDSQNMIVAAQQASFAAHGLEPPSRERALSIVGLSLEEAFAGLVGPDGPAASLAEGYRRAFQRLRGDPAYDDALFPGAAETLEALSRCTEVRLGIATGKSQRGVRILLEREGWGRFFSTIQTADDAPSKPHPAMVEQAMAAVGAVAETTCMVGDSTFDMAMARAAGATPIGVSWGYHRVDALREAGAETIVDSYAELRRLLAARIGAPSLA